MNDYLEKWCCLIIFLKKNDAPLTSFQEQVNHILSISNSLSCTKHIYYQEKIDDSIEWMQRDQKFLVDEVDSSGQKQIAFARAFEAGFRKVILVDGDLLFLETKHFLEAFSCLKIIEFCIGPKKHGGLYLLGMNYFEPAILQNVKWDSPNITKEVIKEIGKLKQALYKLPSF